MPTAPTAVAIRRRVRSSWTSVVTTGVCWAPAGRRPLPFPGQA